ncbi:MAG: hypothetical protein HYT93_00505 [Parcubacteria group bacterium]|nr:hypothetical protein [Parcubacteria group bacterium]
MIFRKNKKKYGHEIDPDEIFLDSHNSPEFDRHQFEGRIERPLSKAPFLGVGLFFLLVALVFGSKAVDLQILRADYYKNASLSNTLRHTILWSERGIIFDRNGIKLADNVPNDSPGEFSLRAYNSTSGLAHVLGYVSYPAKDTDGYFYQKEIEGKDGVERFYGETLAGSYGVKIIETNAIGETESESATRPPQDGESITLSIDIAVSEALFNFIKNLAENVEFVGGAGVIMDVENGEILALVSFPEYKSNILTQGKNAEKIKEFVTDSRKPFLNRVVSGVYTPGSIVKPFIAIAALNEKVIGETEKILSTGSISVPHPYLLNQESVFKDWKAHGWVDVRSALAHSSNVYFYEVGGGFEDQKGLGIGRIEQYMRLFGFGQETGIDIYGEEAGTIPSPEWKETVFNDEWRIGDTYNTAIGQYGFQVTPIQAVRAIAAIANKGMLLTPHIVAENEYIKLTAGKDSRIKIPAEYFTVVQEGLQESVRSGTASALNIPLISVAAKTGTAEVGTLKKFVNSWVIGFFPYEKPRYAFAIVMERGNPKNLIGAPYVMRQMLEWMSINTPQYMR